jgi:hypothetical protein
VVDRGQRTVPEASRSGGEAEAIGHEHDLYLAAVCIINDPKFVALFGYLSYLHYYYIRRAACRCAALHQSGHLMGHRCASEAVGH